MRRRIQRLRDSSDTTDSLNDDQDAEPEEPPRDIHIEDPPIEEEKEEAPEGDTETTSDSLNDAPDAEPEETPRDIHIEDPPIKEEKEEAPEGDTEATQAPKDKDPMASTDMDAAKPEAKTNTEAPDLLPYTKEEADAHGIAVFEPKAVVRHDTAAENEQGPEPTKNGTKKRGKLSSKKYLADIKPLKEDITPLSSSWDTSLDSSLI